MATFTYNEGATGTRDTLRTLLGDINGDDYIFSDEELNVFLSRNSQSLERAAADACRAVAFNAAKQAIVVKMLDTSIDRTELPRIYMSLATAFERQERNKPIEYIDSFAYSVDELGINTSEYIDDDELG